MGFLESHNAVIRSQARLQERYYKQEPDIRLNNLFGLGQLALGRAAVPEPGNFLRYGSGKEKALVEELQEEVNEWLPDLK